MKHAHHADVVIVGAGIAGVALAYRLSRNGIKVALLDRQAPGQEASGGYAGLLTTVADGQASGPYAELSRLALQRTLDIVPELEERSGIDIELTRTPLLRFADDETSLRLLRDYSQRPDAVAAGDRWLAAEQLPLHCPGVSPRVVGAILSAHAHHLNPRQLLAATLAASPGLVTSFNSEVIALQVTHHRIVAVEDAQGHTWHAGHVVLANGAWGAELLQKLGIHLMLQPVRGQLVVLNGAAVPELPCIINTGRGYLIPKRNRRIVVGATHEEAGFEKASTLGGMLHLSRVASMLPRLINLPIDQVFIGLRPMSPDGMPLLGSFTGLDGLSTAMGYGQHGVLLANACADLCARHIAGDETDSHWLPFQAQRAVTLEEYS